MKKAPILGLFVRMEGLEPTHLTAPDPKSGVSTNFTTSAMVLFESEGKDNEIILFSKLFFTSKIDLFSSGKLDEEA